MKVNISLVFSIILGVGIVAFIFTAFQISTERQKLKNELETNNARLAEEFYQTYVDRGDTIDVSDLTDSLLRRYSFTALNIHFSVDSNIAIGNFDPNTIRASQDRILEAIASDSSFGNFIEENGKSLYQYIRVINKSGRKSIAIIFYINADYINNILNEIWLRNFLRWFFQAMLISGVTVLIVRRNILTPINKVVEWVKAARYGNVEKIRSKPPTEFLMPLYKEISNIALAMHEAKAVAQEEAKLRTAAEAVWTPERLNEEMKQVLENRVMVVVSNREPYMHSHEGNEIRCIVPASGMVTAMEPILKACGGLWIASGSGDADKETVYEFDKVAVPPYENKYMLRRVWLTKEQEDHFYYGFSNEGLWPLCHLAHTRPVFRKTDWEFYKQVNELYAAAVLQEIKDKDEPFVLVQDYHFALLPKLIKMARPDARVAIFWHIPWPNAESFGICPWQKEILSGMLGADLIGFHTQYHCNNFLETVNSTLESRVIWEIFSVIIGKHFTLVKPFPISIAFTRKDIEETIPDEVDPPVITDSHGLPIKYIGIGVDRIDYTKGLIEKFLAIERFLEKYPEYIGQFVFVQIGAPSRSLLKSYSDIINAVEHEVTRINGKFRSKGWQPILYLKGHHSHEQIQPYYQHARFCMVTSLHDGMNLVAKEFIAARKNNDGVLILSQFAGASQELHGALIVNPYDIEQTAEAIRVSLEMPLEVQNQKMKQMRRMIMQHNVYSWGASILRTMASITN